MPIYALPRDPHFPPVAHAEPDGLLAVGGDLSPQRLLNAYAQGIFPWFSKGEPIMWWSPDPRMVLFPEELIVHKSMRPLINSNRLRVTFDTDFPAVIRNCSQLDRPGQQGSWIVPAMIDAYTELHRLGYAHSVEVWQDQTLVAGLYGIALGRCFFGESMFTHVSNASKLGFITLVQKLQAQAYTLIDCQQETTHLASLGARPIPRTDFIQHITLSIQQHPTQQGPWHL